MKKKLNDFFDEAKAEELDLFSDSLNAPELSPEVLASIKNRVYAQTALPQRAKNATKAEKRTSRAVWLRVGALAACVCLLITGVFGGLHLFGGENPSAITEQGTPNLPLDQYPPDEVDYANMSMVEYMELFPDFLSYHCLEWKEGYSFAYLEVLSVESGYRWIANLETDGTYCYDMYPTSYYGVMRIKCRVIEDAWGMFEPGAEINLFVEDVTEQDFLDDLDSFLLKMQVGKFNIYDNTSGEQVYSDGSWGEIKTFNCYPVVDGKIRLEDLKHCLKRLKQKNPSYFKDMDIEADLSKVATIVGEGCDVETAVEKLRDVCEKYQSGEYHRINIDLVSKMTYGEYCRMLEGTLTKEDFKKLGRLELALAYAALPGLVTREFSLSDGTKFEICTRIEIPDSYLPELLAEIENTEKLYTNEEGILDSQACIEAIQAASWSHSLKAILHTF